MTKPKLLPDLNLLREKYNYNPDTGILTYRQNFHKSKVGKEAGKVAATGYKILCLLVEGTRLHLNYARVCWAIHHGEDPGDYQIDHINRDKLDNRIDNLRLVTAKENLQNRSEWNRSKSSKLGHAKMTPEARSERSRKGMMKRSAEWRKDFSEKGNAAKGQ